MTLTFFTRNLLELGAVTAPSASAFPVTRLADRDRGPQWQADAAGAKAIVLDLGSGVSLAASAWALVNHNLIGTVEIATSPDGAAWTPRDSAVVTGVDPFYRTFASIASRYWRITTPAAATANRIGELLLGVPLMTLRVPTFGTSEGVRGNVRRDESPGGYVWKAKLGEPRWRARYQWNAMFVEDWPIVEQAFEESEEGTKSFLLRDVDGVLRWVEFVDADLEGERGEGGFRSVRFELMEAL